MREEPEIDLAVGDFLDGEGLALEDLPSRSVRVARRVEELDDFPVMEKCELAAMRAQELRKPLPERLVVAIDFLAHAVVHGLTMAVGA